VLVVPPSLYQGEPSIIVVRIASTKPISFLPKIPLIPSQQSLEIEKP